MKGHLPVICCLPHARERVGAGEPLDVERLAEIIERMFTTDDVWLHRAIDERGEWTFRDWSTAVAAEYARLRD